MYPTRWLNIKLGLDDSPHQIIRNFFDPSIQQGRLGITIWKAKSRPSAIRFIEFSPFATKFPKDTIAHREKHDNHK